jgi:hypothetical protein
LVSRWPLVWAQSWWLLGHQIHQKRPPSKSKSVEASRSVDRWNQGRRCIQRCCPTGINGSISPHVSRRDGEPIREMVYSFVAAQPGHEWGRMDVSMGVEIINREGSWKCKWGRRSAMHRRRDAAFISWAGVGDSGLVFVCNGVKWGSFRLIWWT